MPSSNRDRSQFGWTTSQACIVAFVAFLIGTSGGYWLHVMHPTNPVAQATRQARVMSAQQDAADLLTQAKQDPRNPTLLAKVGYLYYATRHFAQAAEYYKRSVEAKDDAVIRVELGRAYFYAGDPDRALAEFEAVAKADPSNADALFNAGIIRWKTKLDAEGAVADWKQLLKKHPDHPRRKDIEKLIVEAQLHHLKPLPAPTK